MKTSDFDYYLPIDRIAQTPPLKRDSARLMIFDRQTGRIDHRLFSDVVAYIKSGDVIVLNQTRVIPARLFCKKIPSGGKVEILLLRRLDDVTWEALLGGRRLKTGLCLQLEKNVQAVILSEEDGARRRIRFSEQIEPYLPQIGHVPLPPYITAPLIDKEQYQTVYAKDPGSAAAPTAGLHFTEELLNALKQQGVQIAFVTLHVGLDTFLPVNEDSPDQHKIHMEWCQVTQKTVEIVNRAYRKQGRIIAVGTTAVRALETAHQTASEGDLIGQYCDLTDLYILPGYTFKVVDGMITNFHLPKSTLIMLVSAFAGMEILSAYEIAKQEGYRFFSFGDAMLIF